MSYDTPTERAIETGETKVSDDNAERLQRDINQEREGMEFYKTLSRWINTDSPQFKGFAAAMVNEHPTLLGKLANAVLDAVSQRPEDGRLCDLNATLGELVDRGGSLREMRLSEIRQRLI